MKAIGYFEAGSIEQNNALVARNIPPPTVLAHDLLVKVMAMSVNPVDAKVRKNRQPAEGALEVLGWDAVGIVQNVGNDVTSFVPGDRVYYAGAINRAGANAELQCVDARITSKAPLTLSDAESAALPLTAITAWELLFDRLGVPEGGGHGQTLLIIGGAGGVGSMLIQLARTLTRLKVIATASRPETQAWCRAMGAHEVINHHKPLQSQLSALGISGVRYIASLNHTDEHWQQLVDAAAPQGRIALIDDPTKPLDVMALKRKSLSLHWELMFTRSLFQTDDMIKQGEILSHVASLIDTGRLRSTVNLILSPINADNLRRAHALIESNTTCGKIVLHGGFE